MNEDQDRILGNLPRSRPGVRSDKRDSRQTAAKRASAKPAGGAGAKPPANQPSAAKPRKQAARKPAAPAAAPPPPPPPPPPPAQPSRSGDPIEMAVHLVGEVAETGIRAVAKVAGGVLRRLPRP